MNRLLENVLRKGDFSQEGFPGWSPPMDLREDREGFLLTAEVPGMRREDLSVRVDGGVLTIEGRRAREKSLRAAEPLRVETSYGVFARAFPLPAPVDDGRVTARLHLGVLEVFLPKTTDARSRKIQVEVS
jgi:HSP20 family protein